eukprot:Skav224847  [mRNA]  locus=scaffold3408:403918:407966:+ [translate_table: standard]
MEFCNGAMAARYVKYLNRVEILSSCLADTGLLAAEKQQVARALMEVHFSKNEAGRALDKEAFDLLLGPLEDILARKEAPSGAKGPVAPPAGALHGGRDPHRPKSLGIAVGNGGILMGDLSKVGLLGAGGFGAVELWEHKATGETYAMKCISKGFIIKTGMQDSVITDPWSGGKFSQLRMGCEAGHVQTMPTMAADD